MFKTLSIASMPTHGGKNPPRKHVVASAEFVMSAMYSAR